MLKQNYFSAVLIGVSLAIYFLVLPISLTNAGQTCTKPLGGSDPRNQQSSKMKCKEHDNKATSGQPLPISESNFVNDILNQNN